MQRGLLDAALEQAKARLAQGFYVPSFALGQMFFLACQANRCPEIFAMMQEVEVALPDEVLHVILLNSATHANTELIVKV